MVLALTFAFNYIKWMKELKRILKEFDFSGGRETIASTIKQNGNCNLSQISDE